MISEQDFKIVLDAMWAAYVKTENMIHALKNIGLSVDPEATDHKVSFHELYAIQDVASITILDVLGIDKNMFIPHGDLHNMLEALDHFLSIVYTNKMDFYHKYPNGERFPVDYYPDLIDLLTSDGEHPLWNKESEEESDHGEYDKSAYWDVNRFGPFDNGESMRELKNNGFKRFVVTLNRHGDIVVWAHDESEAKDIALTMRPEELEAYADLFDYTAPEIYEYNP